MNLERKTQSNSHNFGKDCIEKVVKRFRTTDLVSALFLLIEFDESLTPKEYLKVIQKGRNFIEHSLKQILFKYSGDNELLVEILGILQRHDLLKAIGSCQHKFKNLKKKESLNNICNLWIVLYQICELFDPIKDMKCLEKFSNEIGHSNFLYLEAYFVEAYEKKLFSRDDVTNLALAFKPDRPDIYEILNQYDEKGDLEFYYIKTPTPCQPCGLALIINHDTFSKIEENDPVLKCRKSSYLDVEALENLWKKFGFEVKSYNNQTDKEIMSIFQNLAASDLSNYDIFVTCYMSHGNKDIVYASNSKPISITTLIDIMANTCKTLFNKPKLFFIQACQGTQIQQGVLHPPHQLPTIHKTELISPNPPLFSDVLKGVSSIPGYVSFVEPNKKSWFVEALVSVVGMSGDKRTFSSLLNELNRAVSRRTGEFEIGNLNLSNCRQTPVWETTLKKEIKLKKVSD